MTSEVWSRRPSYQAPTLDEIEYGVRVADILEDPNHASRRHADDYKSNLRRWADDELSSVTS